MWRSCVPWYLFDTLFQMSCWGDSSRAAWNDQNTCSRPCKNWSAFRKNAREMDCKRKCRKWPFLALPRGPQKALIKLEILSSKCKMARTIHFYVFASTKRSIKKRAVQFSVKQSFGKMPTETWPASLSLPYFQKGFRLESGFLKRSKHGAWKLQRISQLSTVDWAECEA